VLSRRRMLALAMATPVALSGLGACTPGSGEPEGPDPLIALAAAARSDAALAAAAVAADPALADRVEPLRVARTEHAAALDAEVTRLDPDHTPVPGPTGTPSTGSTSTATPSAAPGARPGLDALREAVATAHAAAAAVAVDLPAERAGLVCSVAACCAAYEAVLV
jgi:hypothetical protein